MNEDILRRFFEDQASPDELSRDLVGAMVTAGPKSVKHPIVDMNVEFKVGPKQLIKLCDAVLAGTIVPASLEAIGFCLAASDSFHWDGDTQEGSRVSEAVHDWAAPEINYPLTLNNVRAWRKRLNGEEANFETRKVA